MGWWCCFQKLCTTGQEGHQGSADRYKNVFLGTGKEKEFCQWYDSFRFPSTIHVQVYQIILPNNTSPMWWHRQPFQGPPDRSNPQIWPYPCLYHYCPQHSRIFPSWIFPANKLIVVLQIKKMFFFLEWDRQPSPAFLTPSVYVPPLLLAKLKFKLHLIDWTPKKEPTMHW